MDLVSTIVKSLTSNSSLGALAGKVGVDPDTIEKAIASAIPSLVGSMTKNASTAAGAKSLMGALSQHEDDRDVSDQLKDADEEDGNKIIGKIMGDDKDDFISSIAKKAGINVGQSNQLLSSIAPSLLSSISSAVIRTLSIPLSMIFSYAFSILIARISRQGSPISGLARSSAG